MYTALSLSRSKNLHDLQLNFFSVQPRAQVLGRIPAIASLRNRNYVLGTEHQQYIFPGKRSQHCRRHDSHGLRKTPDIGEYIKGFEVMMHL